MYYIIYPILYLFSLLPWRFIYFLSDVAYGILFYLVGYRRKVVMDNLDIAFPEKSPEEKKRIAKDFYRNFTDTFLEMIKLISISRKELDKRFSLNADVINDLYPTGQNIQFHTGHFFNWEFLNLGVSANIRYTLLGVYIPVANKSFQRIISGMRSQFGTELIPAPEFKSSFHRYAGKPYALGLIADQSPGNPRSAYWYPFFGRMTPFVKGPEKGARSLNTAVIMLDFYKVKRGYYRVDATLLTTTPNELPEGAITKELIQFIEACIRRRPANYLWSHRRWKHSFDPEKHGKMVLH